jgi:ParB/RepB/Spo0J family partition protein
MPVGKREGVPSAATASDKPKVRRRLFKPQQIPVARIRPEEGLARKRDREGHRELCRSIEQFGVLTPITVRLAPDGSGDYLLIKGQGRTLACLRLGIAKVPALVVNEAFAEDEKVQQFLVENVARLRMRPIDRALLIAHARQTGEETAEVAERFGVTAATVRRLQGQLDEATHGEVAALRSGNVNLALHAVIARHVASEDRAAVIETISPYSARTREMEALFVALGWKALEGLGPRYQDKRLQLLAWACQTLQDLPAGDIKERLRQLALAMPLHLDATAQLRLVVP